MSRYEPFQPHHSRVSIRERTSNPNTENLYRPLKETLANPHIVKQHETLTPLVAQSSLVSKEYRRLNTLDLQRMEENTYIPDANLAPTGNLDLVRGEKFVAVDACQRVAGPAISEAEMEVIRRRGMKSSQVVYQIEEKVSAPPPPPPQEKYTAANYDNYGKKPEDYKYNMFSCIDQPVNECKMFGCGKCSGCPSNEVIARENHPPSILKP